MSGRDVGFLDPIGKLWPGDPGRQFQLRELQDGSIATALHGLANFRSGSSEYSYSIFRLPLRKEASVLSRNIYTVDKVKKLLDALRKEAKYLLLFLKSVTKIEVVYIDSVFKEYKPSFSVSIDSRCLLEVNQRRSALLAQLHKTNSCRVTNSTPFTVDFKVTVNNSLGRSDTSHWVVSTHVGSRNQEVLDIADELKIFPWVGVAFELSQHLDDNGRVFCFLPLPDGVFTNLPVHVNGTFSLNDNRRALKWTSSERTNDTMSHWNDLLIKNLLPECYFQLLLKIKDYGKEQFYLAWPNPVKLHNSHWSGLLPDLYPKILGIDCLWCAAFNCWIIPRNAIFIPQKEIIETVVTRVLTGCVLYVVEAPEIVWTALAHYGSHIKVQTITAKITRREISRNEASYKRESTAEKLKLLEFCLADENFSDLQTIALVPLANGQFSKFAQPGSNARYVCSKGYPRSLLPNLDSFLIDASGTLQSKLLKVAKSGKTQLKILNTDRVAQLLPHCFPQQWKEQSIVTLPCSTFPTDWFKIFWNWVQSHDLSLFIGLPVLPLATTSVRDGFRVIKLAQTAQSSVVIVSDDCPREILTALSKLKVNCGMLKYVPFIWHNELYQYVHKSSSPAGILTAIGNANPATKNVSRVSFSTPEATNLQRFLSMKVPVHLGSSQKSVLAHLSMFKLLNSPTMISVIAAQTLSWNSQAILEPRGFQLTITNIPDKLNIFSRAENQVELFNHLKMHVGMPSTMSDLIQHSIFPMITDNCVESSKIDVLMKEIVQLLPVLKIQSGAGIPVSLSKLPFLPSSLGKRKAPIDLFDPTSKELKDLFKGQDAFPLSPFDEWELVANLRGCGLQTSVNAQRLLDILTTVNGRNTDIPVKATEQEFSRMEAVLNYMSSHLSLLKEIVYFRNQQLQLDRDFRYILSQINCLPVLQTSPGNYPESFKWKGATCASHLVAASANVVCCTSRTLTKCAYLVGSQAYFVQIPQQLDSLLSTKLQPSMVLNHFKSVMSFSKQCSTVNLEKFIKPVAYNVYEFLSNNLEASKSRTFLYNKEWIWVQSKKKFVRPQVVALEEHAEFSDSDKLEPYLYLLPEDLQRFSKLFLKFGAMQRFSTPQILHVLVDIRNNSFQEVSPKKQWFVVKSILGWLTDEGKVSVPSNVSNESIIYVPISSSSSSASPQLENVKDVVFSDLTYLRSFYKAEDYKFIHSNVSYLASALGVRPLSKQLNISEAFGDVGPHESLVTRLKNILKDYHDGLTIIKELLQNADDAEATEVNICYDTRLHTDNPDVLLFPGIAKCHGPSLVVHNNSLFSDDDFKNIEKLAGATKSDQHLKIGKFGLGFCSVYHITDVPSFVSGDRLYIFDPALKFLREENQDRSRPGKCLRITEEIVAQSHQLDPYIGLFGFKKNQRYKGTMFRFPFRTDGSKLSSRVYDSTLIDKLETEIREAGSKLLLFLQHVNRLTFSRINPTESDPTLIFEIRRENNRAVISAESSLVSSTFANLLSIDVIEHRSKIPKQTEKWLVGTHRSTDPEYRVSSAACCIIQNGTVKFPSPVQGEMFCFLPLAQKTGLPIHISSNFAVRNDRTGIHSSDRNSRKNSEADWNVTLMQSVVPEAIHTLLVAVRFMCEDKYLSVSSYVFSSLWPLKNKLKIVNPWEELVQPTYELIMDSKLFYSSNRQKWMSFDEIIVLSKTILCLAHEHSHSLPECVVKVMESLKYSLVSLPAIYRQSLPTQSTDYLMEEKKFLEIFFKNFKNLVVSQDTRNKVLHLLLLKYAETIANPRITGLHYLNSYLVNNKCIPCKPKGKTVKHCREIVDPNALFSILYDEEDEVFPISIYDNEIARVALRKLHMISDLLPLKMLIERAKHIQKLYKSNKALALLKVEVILKCVDQQVKSTNDFPDGLSELAQIDFLPVMSPPKRYPEFLFWQGRGRPLQSCSDVIYGEDNYKLVGSQTAIVCEKAPKHGGCSSIPYNALRALKIRATPTLSCVVKHLQYVAGRKVTKYLTENPDKEQAVKKWIEEMCSDICKFFETELGKNTSEISELKKLRGTPCLWTGEEFVSPQSVAIQWGRSGPFLYKLPDSLKSKENLIKALGIQDIFPKDQLLKALESLYTFHSDEPIGSRELRLVEAIVSQLDDEEVEFDTSEQAVYLPDEKKIMRSTSLLVYNDAPWCKMGSDCVYHEIYYKIPRPVALKLGVKPIRSKALESYESSEQDFDGVEFGQHEELTQRIKTILSEYPFDITVIKELLQNADDAKAKQLYFILDKRNHGTNKIPSVNWKDLQGPALLVWNDMGFSPDDLKGIQKLGLGSKRSKSESIGQFGIGFNCVYHLTDCPSFLTNGNTMCILDPHVRYIPGATVLKPGRMYDKVTDGFWENWSDIKSSYLRENVSGCPMEVKQSGSLFRFPLRHNIELVKKSKLIDIDTVTDTATLVLSASKLEEHLLDWAQKMKDGLIFLNNVVEMKFFIIANDSNMLLKFHYKACLEDRAIDQRLAIQHSASKFTSDGDTTPTSVFYDLTLSEEAPIKTSEKWVVKRGIGDSMKSKQTWQFLQQIRPNHGLATPVGSTGFKGNVFCFLPLPMHSSLPVHVNGNFILDAARSSIWQHRDLKAPDDKARWNINLIEAIASSYSEFVVSCQQCYVLASYSARRKIQNSCQSYYSIFPYWHKSPPTNGPRETDQKSESASADELSERDTTPPREAQTGSTTSLVGVVPEGVMRVLAEEMYKKLYERNAKVHIVIRASGMGNDKVFLTEFHPLVNKEDPSNQVHFWESSRRVGNVAPILKRIGLHLSVAPIWLRKHFRDVKIELPEATPATVYAYYKQFHDQVANSGEFPCYIKNTSFQTVEDFKVFSKYLLRKKDAQTSAVEFPDEPWSLPLLLTADNQLCCFDKESKVIHTTKDYSSIFSDSPNHFLHPSLVEIRYKNSYFLRSSDKNTNIVHEILKRAMPNVLHNVHTVKDVARYFPKDKFVLLWKCFENEIVFSNCLTKTVKEWAILLSTDGQGFSCSKLDQLLPVIPPHKPEPSDTDPVCDSLGYSMYELLSKHGMPVLDTTTCSVSMCKKFCPQFSQPGSILSNMFHLHQKMSGSGTLYTRAVLDTNIQKIIMYLAKIHLSQDMDSLSKIKNLPIFCDINHQYQALRQNVYLWPGIVSTVGSDKWLHEHEAIFLPADGDWSQLGTGKELLQIRDISPLSVYTEFIFPKFSNFSHDERISHLKHIRDTEELFKTAFAVSKSKSLQGKNEAALFVAALQQLPCLPVNGVLKPLCEFCDPDEKVFKLFPDNVYFPPKELQNAEWLPFFRNIGLRTKPTKEEFTLNCQRITNGKHSELLAASKILVEHLCYEEDWQEDEMFLREISNIPFVCAQKLPRLAWIKSPIPAKNIVMQGKKSFSLTTLRDSVIQSKTVTIVWTVRSIVELPRLHFTYERKKVNRFFDNIGIALEPTPKDVIQNLCNISQTEFSNVSLLHKYPNKLIAPKRSFSLVDVVYDHFLFLNINGTEVQLDRVRDITCIPVCQEGKVTDIVRPVLVKPVGVVATHPENLKNFLPILNPLPNKFFNVLPRLSLIGVHTVIELEQVQYGLDTIKQYSQEPYDPNDIKVLKELLKKLYQLLPNTAIPTEVSRIKYPLYLPDKSAQTGVLVDSKTLLFDDMGFKNGHFDMSQVEYSFMALLVGRREERGEYGFTAKDIFEKIPTHVQPHPLSLSCTLELNETCTPNKEADQCPLALKLKKACSVPHFAGVVSKILIHKGNNADLCRCFSAHLSKFLENLQVFTVKNLKVNVFLKLVDPPAKIGTASVDFFFQPPHDDQGYFLYLEEKLDPFSVTDLVDDLSKEVTKSVLNMQMSTSLTDLNQTDAFKAVKLMIRVDNIDELQDYLLRFGISISDLQLEESLDRTYKPKVGDPVLKAWHHRLQSDINNFFRPQEMAALEIDEEEYIYVVVEYKIPSDIVADGCDEDEFFEPDKYLIRVKIEDEDDGSETKIVSVIELYKIFSVKEFGNPNSDSTELVIWDQENENVKIWDAVKGDKLKDIMAEICDELRQISKIKDENTKRKAIKAMYLKWHPDKNSNPLATKAFQFLQQQIQRLNDGRPLEDPREDWEPDAHYSHNSYSRYNFDLWDEIVRSRRTAWRQEQRSYQRFGWGSSASDWVGRVRVHREPDKAKAWFEQAEYDFEAMNLLLEKVTCLQNPREQLSAHVCFLACQVAEKSVKAGMYQVCGLQPEGLIHHKFVGYAGALEQERSTVAAGLQSLTRILEDYYVKTRYPNAFCPHAAPANKFSPSNAREAAMVANQILEIVRNIVN